MIYGEHLQKKNPYPFPIYLFSPQREAREKQHWRTSRFCSLCAVCAVHGTEFCCFCSFLYSLPFFHGSHEVENSFTKEQAEKEEVEKRDVTTASFSRTFMEVAFFNVPHSQGFLPPYYSDEAPKHAQGKKVLYVIFPFCKCIGEKMSFY